MVFPFSLEEDFNFTTNLLKSLQNVAAFHHCQGTWAFLKVKTEDRTQKVHASSWQVWKSISLYFFFFFYREIIHRQSNEKGDSLHQVLRIAWELAPLRKNMEFPGSSAALRGKHCTSLECSLLVYSTCLKFSSFFNTCFYEILQLVCILDTFLYSILNLTWI